MSKFKIFRINLNDPKIISRQNRRLIVGYSILFLLTMVTIDSHTLIKEYAIPGIIYYAILSSFLLLTLFFVIKIKRQFKKLKNIGTLEFTKSCIKKVIGDLRTDYPLDKILRIELEKHIQAMTAFQSKSGYVTYMIKIINQDLKEDRFVVSDLSIDFGQKISIVDTLKTLNKISGLDTRINKN